MEIHGCGMMPKANKSIIGGIFGFVFNDKHVVFHKNYKN